MIEDRPWKAGGRPSQLSSRPVSMSMYLLEQTQLKIHYLTFIAAGIRLTDGKGHVTVSGKFWSTDPWWEVTLQVGNNSRKHKFAQGAPAYRLRSDEGVLREKLLMLFLGKCGVAEGHRDHFHNYAM